MLKQKDYKAILRAKEIGLSIRETARCLHHSREKISEVLRNPIPKKHTRRKGNRPSALEQYQEVIAKRMQCEADDLGFCSITAVSVFRFLRDSHGYVGCYAQVLRYLKAKYPFYNKGRVKVANPPKNHERDICKNVLKTLGIVSTTSAQSILGNIAEFNAASMSQAAITDIQTRMMIRELAESDTRESRSNETLSPWLFELLFHNRIPEGLQEIFDHVEISTFRKALASKSLICRKQAATIILCKKGFSLRAVARILSSSRNAVTKYWRNYEENGLNKIVAYRSRRRKANNEVLREAVFSLLHSPPSTHGVNRTSWTVKYLQNTLKLEGHSACTHVIREIIKSAGYKWRKARIVLTSNDPEYREKLNYIKSVLSSLGENERFFSIDEFGPFAVKMKGGRRLVGPDEYPYVPQFQISKGCLIITAALELSKNQVTHFYSKKKNTTEMIKLLHLLLRNYKGYRRIYFSWDSASWHASKAFCAEVEEVNKRAYRESHCTPMVKLAPLPASAQFLNVIESIFSGMARAIIHNSNYQSVEDAMAAIDRYFKERNEYFRKHPKKAGNKIWRKELVPSKFSEGQNCKDPKW